MTAAVLTNQKLNLPSGAGMQLTKYQWSTSYLAGGELLTPSKFGMQTIIGLLPLGANSDGKLVVPANNGQLQCFTNGVVTPLVQGRVTLVAGTATVTVPGVMPAGSKQNIQLHRAVAGGTLGILQVGTRTAGTSFVINSTSGSDTSVVDWAIWPNGTPNTVQGVAGLSDRAVLSGGTITPAQTATCAVTTPQSIFLTSALTGGTPGKLVVGTRTAATSFVINSSGGSDTSSVDFLMVPGLAPASPFISLGRAVLVAGTVTVAAPLTQALASGQQIYLSAAVTGGTPGNLSVGTRTAGTGFVINSDNASDTSSVEWGILGTPGAPIEVATGVDLSNTFVNLLVVGAY